MQHCQPQYSIFILIGKFIHRHYWPPVLRCLVPYKLFKAKGLHSLRLVISGCCLVGPAYCGCYTEYLTFRAQGVECQGFWEFEDWGLSVSGCAWIGGLSVSGCASYLRLDCTQPNTGPQVSAWASKHTTGILEFWQTSYPQFFANPHDFCKSQGPRRRD